MKKTFWLFATSLVLFASCKEGWTDEHKQAYLQACQESDNAAHMDAAQRKMYCDCALEKVMQHYPTIAEVITNKDSTQMRAALEECKRQAAP